MLKPKFFIQKKRCEYNSEENRIIQKMVDEVNEEEEVDY